MREMPPASMLTGRQARQRAAGAESARLTALEARWESEKPTPAQSLEKGTAPVLWLDEAAVQQPAPRPRARGRAKERRRRQAMREESSAAAGTALAAHCQTPAENRFSPPPSPVLRLLVAAGTC